jgi:hypothetical protein
VTGAMMSWRIGYALVCENAGRKYPCGMSGLISSPRFLWIARYLRVFWAGVSGYGVLRTRGEFLTLVLVRMLPAFLKQIWSLE